VIIEVDRTRMTSQEAIDVVHALVLENESIAGKRRDFRVLSIIATTEDRVASFEPQAGVDHGQADEVVWVLRVEGTFLRLRGRSLQPTVFEEAFYVLSDSDGSVIEFGARG
jgi:hypothetical protein